MKTRFSQAGVIIALIAVITVNYFSTTGTIGGITPEFISNKYPTYITPAGYAFAIWGLIYLGIIVFGIYQFTVSNTKYLENVRVFFVISCVANMFWIYAWHNQFLGLSVIAMLLLLGSLIVINLNTMNLRQTQEILFVKAPFSIYFGWVSIATVLNISIFLISNGVTVPRTPSLVIGSLLIVVVTGVSIFIKEKLNLALYPLTIAWAVIAIAVKQSGKTAIVATSAFCVMALIFSSMTFVLKENKKGK